MSQLAYEAQPTYRKILQFPCQILVKKQYTQCITSIKLGAGYYRHWNKYCAFYRTNTSLSSKCHILYQVESTAQSVSCLHFATSASK